MSAWNPHAGRKTRRGWSGRSPAFTALDLTGDCACHYGVLRAAVPDRRQDALGRLTAGHAVSASATLVTNSEADFAGFPGLVVENWASDPGSESAA